MHKGGCELGKTKAFIIGVSNYTDLGEENLPFCKKDLLNFNSAIQEGLGVEVKDICLLGDGIDGYVSFEVFREKLITFINNLENDDTGIFYFSGHGTSGDEHCLVFSNKLVRTQEVIDVIKNSDAKSKVLFLDCCYSGNFTVNKASEINLEETIEAFIGRGYAVLTGSNAFEPSYGGVGAGSIFTNILCTALTNKFLSKEGKLALYDLQLWVKRALEVHSKNNPKEQQHAIYRANLGGTVFFNTYEYSPYQTEEFYYENENFIIDDVKPLHAGFNKRYSIGVILKGFYSDEEIVDLSHKIKEIVMYCDVYNNSRQESKYRGLPANHLFLYFGFSKEDIINSNFYCKTKWVDANQDKDHWYKIHKENEKVINDIYFEICPQYKMLKEFTLDNTSPDDEIVSKVKEIRHLMITIAEKIIFEFNEYENGVITEQELIENVTNQSPYLDELFLEKSAELPLASVRVKELIDAHANLFSTIHDFTLYYNKKYQDTRDSDNRRIIMKQTISRYYDDLKVLQRIENNLVF